MTAISPATMRFGGGWLLALLPAMVALLAMVMLASWHDTLPHVHDAAGTTHVVELGDHHPDDRPQPSDPMHSAAHVVLQGIAIPAESAVSATIFAPGAAWTMSGSASVDSIPPVSILRPPRA